MPEANLILPTPLSAALAPEIARRVYFVDSRISDFSLVERDGLITSIEVRTDTAVDVEELSARAAAVFESEVLPHGVLRRKVIWESGVRRPARPEVFDDLVVAGEACSLGEGQIGIGGNLLALMDCLDDLIRDLVVEEFGAVEFRYPTLMPTRVLEKCDYFASFPQFLMFVTRLHSDSRTYGAFRESYAARRQVSADILADCDNVDYCLPPTMCFHTFSQHERTRLPGSRHRVVTAKGKSFRFESRYATTLERLWDFTIREIVFMGSRDFVTESRRRFMDLAFELITDLGLEGHAEVANDPFFSAEDGIAKTVSQRLLELKYELRLKTGPDRTIAAASFNFHDTFFTERFDIREADGATAHSGCVGFGLERLMFAFLCQHGADPAAWPDQVRERLRGAEPSPRGR
jgi:seryl-tRNA synthetase